MSRSELVVFLARLFLYVREVTQNTGQRVEAIQKWCGGLKGESWCAYFVTFILDLAFGGKAPIARQGSVEVIRQLCKAAGWQTTTPALADLFIYVNAAGRGHHIGFWTAPGPVGIAGNTDATGTSVNGDRVAEHKLATSGSIEYYAYPREG